VTVTKTVTPCPECGRRVHDDTCPTHVDRLTWWSLAGMLALAVAAAVLG